jgi:hypothetical protein
MRKVLYMKKGSDVHKKSKPENESAKNITMKSKPQNESAKNITIRTLLRAPVERC